MKPSRLGRPLADYLAGTGLGLQLMRGSFGGLPFVDWLYHLAQPFIWHPVRAFAIAVGWLLAAFGLPKPLRPPLLTAAIAWGIFALLEYLAWRERADIRVDLLLTWPALCLLTAGCIAVATIRFARRSSRDRRAAGA